VRHPDPIHHQQGHTRGRHGSSRKDGKGIRTCAAGHLLPPPCPRLLCLEFCLKTEGGATPGVPGGAAKTSRGGGGRVAGQAPIVSIEATVSPAQQPANSPHYKGTPLRSPGHVGGYFGAGKEVVFAEADDTLPLTPMHVSGSARMRTRAEASNSAGRSAAASSGHGHDGGEGGPVTAGLISSDYTQVQSMKHIISPSLFGWLVGWLTGWLVDAARMSFAHIFWLSHLHEFIP
jgi:hypothetical protein